MSFHPVVLTWGWVRLSLVLSGLNMAAWESMFTSTLLEIKEKKCLCSNITLLVRSTASFKTVKQFPPHLLHSVIPFLAVFFSIAHHHHLCVCVYKYIHIHICIYTFLLISCKTWKLLSISQYLRKKLWSLYSQKKASDNSLFNRWK